MKQISCAIHIFYKYDISFIFSNLDRNKSGRLDNLSIRMTKLCGDELIYPLKYTFEGEVQEGKYPILVSVHKKKVRA